MMIYIKDLIQIVGEKNVRSDQIERLCYSRDLSVHEAVPDVIVFVKTAGEVSKIMHLANKQKIPVTPDFRQFRKLLQEVLILSSVFLIELYYPISL
ncbi:MAG: hypothetical protein ACPL6D_01385 [Thermodesulfobacteriota bacterium]